MIALGPLTLAEPWAAALLLLPALAALAGRVRRGRIGAAAAGPPGDWARLADPGLRHWLARRRTGGAPGAGAPLLVAAALLALALARPILAREGAPPPADLAARALVIEMAPGVDPAPQRALAERLIAAAPDVPTALIVASAEGFDVAPPTTDRAFLDRYLAVMSPDITPAPGRSPASGVAQGAAALARAGTAAGQILWLPAAPPPPGAPAPPRTGRLLAVVAPAGLEAAWADAAAEWGAALHGPDDAPAAAAALHAAADRVRLTETTDAAIDLRPWLAFAAALAWLPAFRRRAGA